MRGPTGCRYLADDRQRKYVANGWNITGDTYVKDEQGYFCYQARSDDMIVSAGYNIAGPEVEAALLAHPAVAECGVIGVRRSASAARSSRRMWCCAAGFSPSPELTKVLQEHVKVEIAPYKYPRAIEYMPSLPRTQTGKLQRFQLRQIAQAAAAQRQASVEGGACRYGPKMHLRRARAGRRMVQPEGWPRPKGYANGMLAEGRVARDGRRRRLERAGRVRAGFRRPGGAGVRQYPLRSSPQAARGPEHLVRLTWYVVDMDEYTANLKEIGRSYREVFGAHYPAMAVVQVVRLVEPAARLEIEATAVLPPA